MLTVLTKVGSTPQFDVFDCTGGKFDRVALAGSLDEARKFVIGRKGCFQIFKAIPKAQVSTWDYVNEKTEAYVDGVKVFGKL